MEIITKIILVFMALILLSIGGVWFYNNVHLPYEKQVNSICCEENISPCNDFCKQCFYNCKEFNLKYFRCEFGKTVFEENNCWCKEGNGTKQIY